MPRCWWGNSFDDYRHYHDHEWSHPVHDDHLLFQKVVLEGFQSGLSWLTILRKRENFRAAFANFDFEKVARFDDKDIARLLADAGIVRHRGKIEAAINNAQRACELVEEAGSLDQFFWQFIPPPDERPQSTHQSHPLHPRHHPHLHPPLQGAQEARLEIRRPHHRLRLHASLRLGQRPPRRLRLSLSRRNRISSLKQRRCAAYFGNDSSLRGPLSDRQTNGTALSCFSRHRLRVRSVVFTSRNLEVSLPQG